MQTRLLSLEAAHPERCYAQGELLEIFGYERGSLAATIFEHAMIETRHLSYAPDVLRCPPDARTQMANAFQALLPLAEQAAHRALASAGTSPSEIGCVVVASSTGYYMPGLSAWLVSKLHLAPDAVKWDMIGAGCLGAVPALSLADEFLRNHPERKALVLCADVGGFALRRGDPEDKMLMVTNALFGDAAVAMVLSGAPGPAGMPQLLDFQHLQGEGMLDSVYLAPEANGVLAVHLHRELPQRAGALFEAAIRELLMRNGLPQEAVAHWVFHPGGPAILRRVQAVLGLGESDLALSWEVLRTRGNTSSPTCLLALERLLTSGRAAPGDYGVLGAIGPGLTVGVALLRWV